MGGPSGESASAFFFANAPAPTRAPPGAVFGWGNRPFGGRVSCGGHDATSCARCGDLGDLGCNGDCKWSRGVCIPK